jgi:enoyl-CoA hydratase/carnithine racemase
LTAGVALEVDGHIARITITRPEVANALRPSDEDELARLLREADGDPRVRIVVLTGAGDRAFCAGADLKHPAGSPLEYWSRIPLGGFGGVGSPELSVPVLARVNGHALGGGLEMVVSADLAIASADATFGLTEARVGNVPMGGAAPQVTRQLPRKTAMSLLLTGRRFGAAEALNMNLVNEVVPADRLDEAVDRWIDAVLACAPLAVRATKQIVNRTSTLPLRDAAALMVPELLAALVSDDAAEGNRAFREGRDPQWSGT